MKFFNTAGPVNPEKHYCLKPLERINLDEILTLIDNEKYFILHAPRQTGKTSCLLALMNHLNEGETYRCAYVNVESAQTARENVASGIQAILSATAYGAELYLKESFLNNNWKSILEKSGAHDALREALAQWTRIDSRPLILMIDEIDALVGDTLISVLRQLRAGYTARPDDFPQSVILCGVRDIRDYRIHTAGKEIITGGSAFNIKAESLRLGNFTKPDVMTLYLKHTEETGQEFTPDVFELAWELTEGQPWLVNALAYEVSYKMKENRDRSRKITAEMIETAKENLIQRRETHLDQLTDKLREERVRRVIEPILSGNSLPVDIWDDDAQYVEDLGLIYRRPQWQITNPIYREIIPRILVNTTQETITQEKSWYVSPASGRLDMNKLLLAFQEFFRENSEHWLQQFQYREAGPQLLLQAFLQRIVNGGGRVEREYALGSRRTDLLVKWNHPQGVQKIVIELKILYHSLEATLEEGTRQTADYMDLCATQEGYLLIFDRTSSKSWDEKIFHREITHEHKTLQLLGM
ncbi:AAA-like domain-containing protein [Deltaproteobacteria bacterium TL4]